jgi:hypothetical protein
MVNRQVIGRQSFPHVIHQDGKDGKKNQQNTSGIRHK